MITVTEREEFDFLGTEYRDLFARSDAGAFQHPLWLDGIYSRLVPASGVRPAIVEGRERDGRLVMVMPLIRRGRFPFGMLDAADLGVSDYATPVMDRDLAGRLASGAERLPEAAALARSASLGRFRKVRADEADRFAPFGPTRTTPMGVSTHEMAISAPFAAWRRTALDPSFLRSLDKKRKRLRGKGEIRFEPVTDPARIAETFEIMREFRRHRWPDDVLNREAVRDFYVDMASRGIAEGLTETLVMSIGGIPRTVIFGLIHRGRFIYLMIGFDVVEMRNHSLGFVAVDQAIERCTEQGLDTFDFSIGDEAYKASYPVRSVPMLTLWAARPPVPALAHATLRGVQLYRGWRERREAAAAKPATAGA